MPSTKVYVRPVEEEKLTAMCAQLAQHVDAANNLPGSVCLLEEVMEGRVKGPQDGFHVTTLFMGMFKKEYVPMTQFLEENPTMQPAFQELASLQTLKSLTVDRVGWFYCPFSKRFIFVAFVQESAVDVFKRRVFRENEEMKAAQIAADVTQKEKNPHYLAAAKANGGIGSFHPDFEGVTTHFTLCYIPEEMVHNPDKLAQSISEYLQQEFNFGPGTQIPLAKVTYVQAVAKDHQGPDPEDTILAIEA